MPRSRSRSPRRGYDRHQRKRSRSPYQGNRRHRSRSRSPRRRRRSKSRSPPPRRPRSPFGGRGHYGRGPREEPEAWKTPANPANMTLGGSLGVTLGHKPKKKKQKQKPVLTTMPEDMTDEDKMMQEIMGFQGFDTTKGKKVKGNDVYAINKKVERKYRQYMNRKGGFNRPLEFMP